MARRKPKDAPYACMFCDGPTEVLRATVNRKRGVMERLRKCKRCRREQHTMQPLSELKGVA